MTETSPLLHDANCVYCHVDLALGDHTVVCDACKSPHHVDCWEANGGRCATFGCKGARAANWQPSGTSEVQPSIFDGMTVNKVIWQVGAIVANLITMGVGFLVLSFTLGLFLDILPNHIMLIIMFAGMMCVLIIGKKVEKAILHRRDRYNRSSESADNI